MSVFRNLSEHSIVEKLFYAQLLFISSTFSLISTPTNKMFHGISLSVEQNAMRNFARLNEISMIWEQ